MTSKAIRLILISVCLFACSQMGYAQRISLITTNTFWRYNKSGADLGTTWVSNTYRDTVAGWEGPSLPLFGFETDEGEYANVGATFKTRFPDPQNPPTNYRTNFYFRTHFIL